MARPDRAVLVDAGLTVVLGVAFLASTAGASDARALDGLGVALLAANVLPLLALRRAPLLVLACLSVAYPVWASLEYPTHLLQSLPTLAAMFVVGASPRPLWWRALALLTPVEMLAAWRSYTAALEEKTAALEAARQELAHRAVLEERTRIARDLHDILAHAMSVITVQAGVGAHLLERDPEQARRALRVIEETGRGALGEMRRLLGALRAGDPPTEPQPGLASLDRLASQATAAGVPVELQVEGPARPLPAGLEVSAYRIAQEALTNTIKHAPGGRARVTVRYRPHTVELEVVDTGAAAKGVESAFGRQQTDSDRQDRRSGQGLRGMRERVALYGGVFEAGACGFLVKDTPPVELLRAVHQTAAGGTVISPPTARRLVRDLAASRPDPRPTPAALQDLTERELEVLWLLARGHSNREIAGSWSSPSSRPRPTSRAS